MSDNQSILKILWVYRFCSLSKIFVFPMCIKSVFESINNIFFCCQYLSLLRVRRLTTREITTYGSREGYSTCLRYDFWKNYYSDRIYIYLRVTYYYCFLWNIHLSHSLVMLEPPVDHMSLLRACTFLSYRLYSSYKSQCADSTASVCQDSAFFLNSGIILVVRFCTFSSLSM